MVLLRFIWRVSEMLGAHSAPDSNSLLRPAELNIQRLHVKEENSARWRKKEIIHILNDM